MKTGISIPDQLFEQAEGLADRLGISRSELYQRAIAAFLSQNAQAGITEKLNEVYDSEGAPALDSVLAKLQLSSLSAEEW
jgi:metal-responsive CopG/Arc/MetJ family transcriptional regulator